MKWKKFDNTNIENPVNNTRNLKDILQHNDMLIMKLLTYRNRNNDDANMENPVNNARNMKDIYI